MADPAAVRLPLGFRSPARLLHVYGPTETTTFALWYEVHDVPKRLLPSPLAGLSPEPRHTLWTSPDSLRHPVLPGELYIGGAGVALGYLGDEGMTSERFLMDPWNDRSRIPALQDRRQCRMARGREPGAERSPGWTDQAARVPHRTW